MKRYWREMIVIAATGIFLVTAVLLYWNIDLFTTVVSLPEEGSITEIDGTGLGEKNNFLLDLNTATVEQLMLVPGIGRDLAERIFRYREQNGRFQTVWELDSVEGIGSKLMQKLEPYFYIP